MMPETLPFTPRGLSRDLAALYVGVSPSLFDRMVTDGRMPPPRVVDGISLWDRYAIDAAFSDLGTTQAPASHPQPSFQPAAFSAGSLAKRWGCSDQQVRRLCRSGELPSFKAGGKLLRIRREDVEAFERRKDEPPPETEPVDDPPKRKRAAPLDPLTRARVQALRSRVKSPQ